MRCLECGWPGQSVYVKCCVCGSDLERPLPAWPGHTPEESRPADRAPGWGGEDEPEQPDDAWPLAIERRLLRCDRYSGVTYMPPVVAFGDMV